MNSPVAHHIAAAREAWELGLRQVMAELNVVLRDATDECRFPGSPVEDVSFSRCCDDLSRALGYIQAIRPDLPSMPTSHYWRLSANFGCSENNEMRCFLGMLRQLDVSDWNAEVLTPVADHANRIREFFDNIQAMAVGDLVRRDPHMEARDAFIYDARSKLTPHKQIIAEIKRNPDWESIESPQGINGAAKRYAKRHGLPVPQKGKRGRPRRR